MKSKTISHNGISYCRLKKWRPIHNLYELVDPYELNIGIVGFAVNTEHFRLSCSGLLSINAGYRWDGPSGPTFDTKTFMRGSLIHDPPYEAMRKGLLPFWVRPQADAMLYRVCLEDGMCLPRAAYTYIGVSAFAAFAALPV